MFCYTYFVISYKHWKKWRKYKCNNELQISGIGTETKNDLLNKNVFIISMTVYKLNLLKSLLPLGVCSSGIWQYDTASMCSQFLTF